MSIYYTEKNEKEPNKKQEFVVYFYSHENARKCVRISTITVLTNIIKISTNLIDTKILQNSAGVYWFLGN